MDEHTIFRSFYNMSLAHVDIRMMINLQYIVQPYYHVYYIIQ